jgi:ribosomal protein L37AE/L43A
MYNIKNKEIDLDVTLNHRMYIKDDTNDEYILEKAENIIGKKVTYKNNAIYDEMEEAILIIETLIGDGNEYITNDVRCADVFMKTTIHAGWSSIIEIIDNKYHVKINKNNNIIVNDGIIEDKVYDYKGSVYCIEVPTEIFMVRKNGKAVWTGNSRSRGPMAILTRQPTEGRAREGGLRFGEMERDCVVAHGMAEFTKERLMECSDAFSCYTCKDCGLLAIANPEQSIWACRGCSNSTNFSHINIPYATKLLLQELETMCIGSRLITEHKLINNTK